MVFLIFVSAYSISEAALNENRRLESSSAISENDNQTSTFSWHQETAIFICPIH